MLDCIYLFITARHPPFRHKFAYGNTLIYQLDSLYPSIQLKYGFLCIGVKVFL